MSLIIYAVGDIMLGEHPFTFNMGIRSKIASKGTAYPFIKIKHIFEDGDVVFGNLEAPISMCTNKKNINRDFFRSDPDAINCLIDANFNMLSVSNNHIMEHGRIAFNSTIKLLKNNNILPAGVSRELSVLNIKGYKLGIVSYSFIEDFSLEPPYNKTTSGDDVLEDLRSLRDSVDIIILSLHWGNEFIERPSPFQILFAHEAIDSGANIILGHHPHVLQGIEHYHDGLIAYSLGNFIFDMQQNRTRMSIILRISISEEGIDDLQIIPTYLNDNYQPETLSHSKAIKFLSYLNDISSKIKISDKSYFISEAIRYNEDLALRRRECRMELIYPFLTNIYKYPLPLMKELVLKQCIKTFRALKISY